MDVNKFSALISGLKIMIVDCCRCETQAPLIAGPLALIVTTMNKLFLIFVVLILALNSCKKIEPKMVFVLNTDYLGERTDTQHFSLLQYDSLNFKVFNYTDSTTELGSLLNRYLIIDAKNPDYIMFDHDTIKFNTSKVFSSYNKHFLVKRYIAQFIDNGPELGIYTNDSLGILFIQSYNNGRKFSFITDSKTQSLTRMISNDTTGFILNRINEDIFFKNKNITNN